MKKFTIFCLTLLSLVTTPVFAQIDTSVNNPQTTIELQPQFPKPGESFTATFNDYTSAYGSSFTWVFDGKEIPDLKNQRKVVLTANTSGKSQVLKVVYTKSGGNTTEISQTINPVYLDVIIEPQTRVPDFYLGRSLPSIGSMVNATALISGDGFRNPNLIYKWTLGHKVIEEGPIIGRNQVSFITPMGEELILSVKVSDLDGTVIAERTMMLYTAEPKLQFYEVNPLYGVSQKPISGDFVLSGKSAVIKAEPYNLDSRVYNNPTVHEWKIGGASYYNTGTNPYEVTLKREGLTGYSDLQFHVRDTVELLQGAKASIGINF
jgi:hypothetical protein